MDKQKGYPPYAISPAHTAGASTLPERSVENGEAFSTRLPGYSLVKLVKVAPKLP